jgi:hypothetical protein
MMKKVTLFWIAMLLPVFGMAKAADSTALVSTRYFGQTLGYGT